MTDKDILMAVEKVININYQDLEESMHSDLPSHAPELVLGESIVEKNNALEDATLEVP